MKTEKIALTIKNRRKARGLTQQEAAEMAGVALNVIKAIEAGQTTMKVSNLIRVASLFGLHLELFEGKQ